MNEINLNHVVDTTPHTSTLNFPEGTIIYLVGFNKNVPIWKRKVFNLLDKIIKSLTNIQRKL